MAFFAVAQAVGMFPAVLARMLYFIIAQLFSLLLDLFFNRSPSDRQKDLEIMLLRQQLSILQRRQSTPHISR
jgi:hypothetical protein